MKPPAATPRQLTLYTCLAGLLTQGALANFVQMVSGGTVWRTAQAFTDLLQGTWHELGDAALAPAMQDKTRQEVTSVQPAWLMRRSVLQSSTAAQAEKPESFKAES